jgi:hypothetical protein
MQNGVYSREIPTASLADISARTDVTRATHVRSPIPWVDRWSKARTTKKCGSRIATAAFVCASRSLSISYLEISHHSAELEYLNNCELNWLLSEGNRHVHCVKVITLSVPLRNKRNRMLEYDLIFASQSLYLFLSPKRYLS